MVQPNQGPLPTTLRQPFSNGFRQESSDVARAGLAEERTEEFLKPARVGQLTCVNRRDSADTDFPRLRKHYYWHRDGDRLSMFQWRSSLHNYHLVCLSVPFVEGCFWNICLRHHQQCDGEKQVSDCKSSCPCTAAEHWVYTCSS